MSHKTQNKKTAEILRGVCDSGGYTFHPDYSGRYMMGATCVGISGKGSMAQMMIRIAAYIVEECSDDVGKALDTLRELEDPSWDQLGLGSIVYWPDITE